MEAKIIYFEKPGGENTEVALSLVQTSDEGYALAGYVYYNDVNYYWIVKTDSHGSMEWTYGGVGYEGIAYSIIETFEGSLAVVGTNGLTKLDSLGIPQIEGANGDDCRGVIEVDDGGFLLSCRVESIDSETNDLVRELGVIKVDSEGKQVWNRTYGEGHANSIIATNDANPITKIVCKICLLSLYFCGLYLLNPQIAAKPAIVKHQGP